jgi:hypothetical protein
MDDFQSDFEKEGIEVLSDDITLSCLLLRCRFLGRRVKEDTYLYPSRDMIDDIDAQRRSRSF